MQEPASAEPSEEVTQKSANELMDELIRKNAEATGGKHKKHEKKKKSHSTDAKKDNIDNGTAEQ